VRKELGFETQTTTTITTTTTTTTTAATTTTTTTTLLVCVSCLLEIEKNIFQLTFSPLSDEKIATPRVCKNAPLVCLLDAHRTNLNNKHTVTKAT